MINKFLIKLESYESAQGLIEYELIVSLISIFIIGSLLLFGDQVSFLYQNILSEILNVLNK